MDTCQNCGKDPCECGTGEGDGGDEGGMFTPPAEGEGEQPGGGGMG